MLGRLTRALSRFDTALIVIAVLNFLNIWRAVAGSHGSVAWYAAGAPLWSLAPSRLLLATLCLVARRWWTEVAAAALSAHVFVSIHFYYLAPDYLALEWHEPTLFEMPAF